METKSNSIKGRNLPLKTNISGDNLPLKTNINGVNTPLKEPYTGVYNALDEADGVLFPEIEIQELEVEILEFEPI